VTIKFECVEVNAPVKAMYCDNCKCVVKGNELMVDDKGRFTHICGNPVSAKTKEEITKLVEKQKEWVNGV